MCTGGVCGRLCGGILRVAMGMAHPYPYPQRDNEEGRDKNESSTEEMFFSATTTR
ncbi:hypothetical protein FACS1894129_7200 [Actinomycetota bacterium]|nr:hypothetical protein FACS1894129_7200 [Actinomycetota bacterium]